MVDGAFVVRIGFPLNFAASVAATVLLLTATRTKRGFGTLAAIGTIGFEATSLAVLVATRMANFLGWSEHVWTPGAQMSLALEAAAMLLIGAALFVRQQDGIVLRGPQRFLTPARVAH